MSELSSELFSAFDVLMDSKLAKLKLDKTIQAEVYSIENLDTGEYKVKYNSNIFSAYAANPETSYKVGEDVFIIVPENDFDQKKIIVTKASDQSLSYNQLTMLQNQINEVSPTFDTWYKYNTLPVGVVAGAATGSGKDRAYIYQEGSSMYHGMFTQYANKYEYIRIQASFLTQFQSTHSKGNYGIIVEFHANNDTGVARFKLDLNSFNGDPYRLGVASPQSVILKVQINYLTGLKSIYLFEEGFEYDKIPAFDAQGRPTTRQNTTNPNIFVSDVKISYVEKIDLSDTNYYLKIAAPQGNALTSTIPTIALKGQLIHQGRSLLTEKTCECHWYRRDLTITPASDSFDKQAGYGWKRVAPSAFDTLTLKPYVASATAEQKELMVFNQAEYKLIVIYNDEVVTQAEIEVFNLQSGYDYHLAQVTTSRGIELQLVNNKTNDVLVADWYVSYPDGSYDQFTGGQKQNSVVLNNYLLYSTVSFYAQVYNYAKNTIVGTLKHVINNNESDEDVTISYDGDDSFRYDANGDIAITDSELERRLKVSLSWKEGVGTAYKIQWYGPDGRILTDVKYNPSNSMITNLRVDSSNILHYNINQKYHINYNNNVITIKVITIDDRVYTFKKEILFLKDGDQGTNGTTYVVAIRPCNSDGTKLSGFTALQYNSNSWRNTMLLQCYVYKDGELINNNSKYSITYTWDQQNVALQAGSKTYQKVAVGLTSVRPTSSTALQCYVKVQATIVETSTSARNIVYTYYPIDVVVGSVNTSDVDISDIPSYIKYTASGVNPQFYNKPVAFTYKNSRSSYIDSLNTNLIKITSRDGEKYLNPVTKFTFESQSIGVIRCTCGDGNCILHPIMMYLDTYGNEDLNGWDGTALAIDKDRGQYVFAPQVGAGEKDSYNRFTGIILAKANDGLNGTRQWGVYGYQNGLNTFGLLQNGKAYFGRGGGQIVVDGTSATIKGGGGGTNENGMTIALEDTSVSGTTKAIQIGANKFYVNYNGYLYAQDARIEGTIVTSDITATGGYIGGWTINGSDGIQSRNGGIVLNSNGSMSAAGGKFTISTSGDVYLNGDIYTENIVAEGGTIGGWTIASTYLGGGPIYSGSRISGFKTALYNDGRIVSNNGITTNQLDIYTTIYSGSVSNPQPSGQTYLGYIGWVPGEDGYGITNNIGIKTTNDQRSIIIDSARNIALKAGGYGIQVHANNIYVKTSASNQHGIYARFA